MAKEVSFGSVSGHVVIKCDNEATLALLRDADMQSFCIKHIDNRHHQCRKEIELGHVAYEYCPSAQNLADCLTKSWACGGALKYQFLAMGPVL